MKILVIHQTKRDAIRFVETSSKTSKDNEYYCYGLRDKDIPNEKFDKCFIPPYVTFTYFTEIIAPKLNLNNNYSNLLDVIRIIDFILWEEDK